MVHRRARAVVLACVFALAAGACGSDSEPNAGRSGSDEVHQSSAVAVETTAPVGSTSSAAPTTTTTTTTTTVPEPTPLECIGELPLRTRLGQLLFPVVVQQDLSTASELAADGLLTGVVLVGDPDTDIAADLALLQAAATVGPVIVAVDEEGGRVQRVAGLAGPMPSARRLVAEATPAEAREIHAAHAERLGELGFTMNLAPVLDLDVGEFIRDRALSADPGVVAEYGEAVALGIADAGLTPVFKHFPGHGRGVDSHTGLPRLPEIDVLRQTDLVPFVELIDRVDAPVMIGHLVVPGTTGDEPASLSAELITGVLRQELGFDGVVMTDALNMDAIADRRNGAEAAIASIAAGADLAMVGQVADVLPALDAMEAALGSGELDPVAISRSVERVLGLRGIDPCVVAVDRA